jgi:hypothetical protein
VKFGLARTFHEGKTAPRQNGVWRATRLVAIYCAKMSSKGKKPSVAGMKPISYVKFHVRKSFEAHFLRSFFGGAGSRSTSKCDEAKPIREREEEERLKDAVVERGEVNDEEEIGEVGISRKGQKRKLIVEDAEEDVEMDQERNAENGTNSMFC